MAKVFKFRPELARSLTEQQSQWAATRPGGLRIIASRRLVSFWKGVVVLAVVVLAVAAIIYASRRRLAPPGVSWRDWTPE